MNWKWIILLIYNFNFLSLQAQPLIILDNEEKNTFGKYTSILEDPTNNLKVNDLIKEKDKFAVCTKDVFSSTKTTSAFWIKFQVKNPTDKNYYLVIDNPFINKIEFYSVDHHNKITLLAETGNLLPFSSRPVQINNFIFPINLSKGDVKTYYIKYYSTWRMEIPLSIQTSKKIFEYSALKGIWYGVFYGILIVNIIYVFFLYLIIREKSFVYYLLLTFSVGFFRSLNQGLIFQFGFPNHPLYNNFLIYLGYSLLGFFMIRFSQEFLKTKERIPKFHRWGNYINAILITIFFVSFFSKIAWSYASNIMFVIFVPYIITVALKSYFQGFTPARFYLISAASYGLNFGIAVIRNYGFLPYSFVFYNMADAFVSGIVIFFALAIGDRFNQLKIEKKEAKDNLNKELESKIQERSKAAKEQKKLNESLEQSLALSAATLESTADGILVVDKNGKISGYNQKFVDMWNIPNQILETKDDNKTISIVLDQLENPKTFIKKVQELYAKPEEESFDVLEFKDGRIFERYSKPQKSGDNIIGRVWSFRDITDRKETEQKNKQLNINLKHKVEDLTNAKDELKKVNLELLQTNTDLDNFIYTASHDLKIPISNIEGLINILRTHSYDKKEFKEILDLLDTSVNKFKNTAEDLIEITSVQRMRQKDIEDNDIKKLIKEVSLSLDDIIKSSKANIKIEVDENPIIRFSKNNLIRILENVISNAIKFRSPKRNLEILIKTQTKGDYIVLCIQDNGLGINEAYKQRVFELFKKAHDHIQGKGIGLYIIKRIIENAGGRIELESEEGKGSIFSLYFRKDI